MLYNANNIKYNQTQVKYNGAFTTLVNDYSNLTTISTTTINLVPASYISFSVVDTVVVGNINMNVKENPSFAEVNYGLVTLSDANTSNEIQSNEPVIAEIKTINISTLGSSS